jgi:integrase
VSAASSHRRPPSYRHHKATGQAVVTLNNKDFYLGVFDSPESKEAYNRIVAEWLVSGRQLLPKDKSEKPPTVAEIMAAFWLHAEGYYVGHDGKPTSELLVYQTALRPLVRLYGSQPARNFGPLALKAVREEMVKANWARSNINKQINRVRHMFKWAASQELVPASVHESLCTLSGLRAGRTDARESIPVKPVPDGDVQAIKPFVGDQVWSLIQLQLLTGARAGELVKLRPVDLDMTKDVWTHSPPHHKTAHHGHKRTIYFGPKGQEVIRPYLANRPVSAFLFSPVEAEENAHKLPDCVNRIRRSLFE